MFENLKGGVGDLVMHASTNVVVTLLVKASKQKSREITDKNPEQLIKY